MNNIAITIPPFPSQDLAKLVLGYLAEEQLMTAYDEFLQASPYLDAFRNEYDRIFMTSLKNILAEYRAVKIYVETCKPYILRRKLFQCPNLLEIVKFLINNVDINKLHVQEGNVEKAGQNRHSLSKSNVCDVCISLKLPNCVCKTSSQTTSQIEATTLENSVEATSLADLPGNTSSYKKKVAKLPENQSSILASISSSYQCKDNVTHPVQCQDHLCSTNDERSNSLDNINNVSDPRHIVQDLNNVLNLVNHNRSDIVCKQNDYSNVENETHKRISSAGTFQDFSTAVDSSTINRVNVPDSSTSENNVLQSSSIETENVPDSVNSNKANRLPQILIRVGPDPKNMGKQLNTTAHGSYSRIVSKDPLSKPTEEQSSPKITILSDIKVDDMKMPPVLRTATSTPVVKMQTLLINGMPAYKQQSKQNYTQDEIMAMPTIILVPASDGSKDTVPTVTQNNTLPNNTKCTEAVSCSTGQSLGPLVIDVTSPEPPSEQIENTNSNDAVQFIHKQNSDVSHMSLPKDNLLASIKSSTPQVLPPKRKSSSTPRRTSHVRVLDFTTPRRILHETINEKSDLTECSTKQNVELPGAGSIGAINNNINDETKTKVEGNVYSSGGAEKKTIKEKKTAIKLYNWDANLRALAYVGNGNIEKTEITDKPKSKKKKKLSPKGANENITKVKKISTKKVDEKKIDTPKNRNTKSRKKSSELSKSINEQEEKVNISSVPVKPTINIISRNKRPDPVETDKNQNKSSNTDEQIDTPELEKMSLQNEIGAKLNISDLLETPYKQVLYEMQMDTPKFLGPDLPDVPLSDIKIMNIPTPRFLNTPKLTQNTPSSYSSRPTDYSSGGSYYKPDDQDYVLATEVMECALSVDTKNTIKESTSVNIEAVTVEKVCEGKSRPVRKCTKNVSYNYSSNVVTSKIDAHDDKFDKSSTCSDNSVNKTVKLDKVKTPNPDKDNKKGRKSESKKKSKKYKSPKRKETFMKIKPRRTTPVKEISGRGRRKTTGSVNVYIKPQAKKIMPGKDKNASLVPDIVPVSTKSRRKSSTPRKLHCTKIFNSESSGLDSPDRPNQDSTPNIALMTNLTVCCNQDSDTEPLRWSDEAPQSSEIKTHEDTLSGNDSDDISKIKEYLSNPLPNEIRKTYEGEGSLQVDLIKRGFDVETARKIELDLSGTPTHIVHEQQLTVLHVSQPLLSTIDPDESEAKKPSDTAELNGSPSNDNKNDIDEDETDEFDFSVHESNEDTNNYFSYKFDEATFVKTDQVKLKETFSMEICIEDDVAIRLRAMPFNTNFEQESKDRNEVKDNEKPTEIIETPCKSDNLYTPRKAQCYEIFDSTLASLDTPLKPNSPRPEDSNKTVTEIVLEVEKIETDTKKTDSRKRKRLQSDSSNGTKKSKADTPYLLNSASIQNIDIESVLSKLHGP